MCGLVSLIVPVVVCCENDNGPVQEHVDYLSSFQLIKLIQRMNGLFLVFKQQHKFGKAWR